MGCLGGIWKTEMLFQTKIFGNPEAKVKTVNEHLELDVFFYIERF